MTFKEKYTDTLRAAEKLKSMGETERAEWLLERCRGDEISARISVRYPPNAQNAMSFNAILDLVNGTDTHLAELRKYEANREAVKNEVDGEIAEIRRQMKW